MKKLLSILIVVTGFAFIPVSAYSQEDNGCFMLDPNGQAFDLTDLCTNSTGGGGSQTTYTNPTPRGLFTIPIKRRQSGIPVIDVVVNGQHTFEMMLDTGASASVLTPAMAKTLNLTVNRYVVAETPGGTVSLPVGSVESLQAGGAVARNLEVAVSDALTFGLLGQDFFRNYDITIKENVIEFRSR